MDLILKRVHDWQAGRILPAANLDDDDNDDDD